MARKLERGDVSAVLSDLDIDMELEKKRLADDMAEELRREEEKDGLA